MRTILTVTIAYSFIPEYSKIKKKNTGFYLKLGKWEDTHKKVFF